MSRLSATTSELSAVADELSCYLHTNSLNFDIPENLMQGIDYSAQQNDYALPLGQLRLLNITLYLPLTSASNEIESARKVAIKSALAWLKRCFLQDKLNKAARHYVLALDVQLVAAVDSHDNLTDEHTELTAQRLIHSFGARFFIEELVIDVNEHTPLLQIFGAQDWQTILVTLKTPCELWQFLGYHMTQLQHSSLSGKPSFESEQALLMQFMHSEYLFTQAITIDNALLKYGIQDQPNAALVTMSLAQRQNSDTAKMYRQHMQQAATLWAQLSAQMLDMQGENASFNDKESRSSHECHEKTSAQRLLWQQQLLNESLFSRHELMRTLYEYPKQTPSMQQSGYVVHQHSYSSLGRHYVLIFYGQAADAQKSKSVIQLNLSEIARDVATRLPLTELHHVVVLGIAFIKEYDDTFIDIDLWIQPVVAMTQKERQLTKQLQALKQQHSKQKKDLSPLLTSVDIVEDANPKIVQNDKINKLSGIKLSLSIPSRDYK